MLHAHLPFVRHPEHDVFLEEDWLYEAITESYIPLLRCLERLRAEGIDFRLTLSLSPTLLAMLSDDLLRRRYDRHLSQLRQLIARERPRTKDDAGLARLVAHYAERLDAVEDTWQSVGGNLIAPFAQLQREGYLDILTSAATHGYLPLLSVNKHAVWAQISVAVDYHERVIGRIPSGIWLPECAYSPEIDPLLARAGLRYFVADAHALLHARPRPRFGVHAPAFSADSGVAVFARDLRAAEQVWSREHGYPGDAVYREFYRDVGFELPHEVLGPLIQPNGHRRYTGIKYHAISGADADKSLYRPDAARERALEHAHDFVAKRVKDVAGVRGVIPNPLIVAAYDAELFGHWWYEGPQWLEATIREATRLPVGALELVHLRGYLQRYPTHQLVRPAISSWGEGGYHQYWLGSENAWIYPRLHQAAEQMTALARRFVKPTQVERRFLDHAARQLLLAQASDWAFLMRSNTASSYATERSRAHLSCFDQLVDQLSGRASIDLAWLEQCEQTDTLFPNIDYRVYAEPLA